MGFFNSGGIVTRGMGDDHRLVTRGYGERFDFGGIGIVGKRRHKEYVLDLFAPILRENLGEIGIYSPLEMRGSKEISISLGVPKEIRESMNLLAGLDYSKLSEVLDAI